MIEDLRDHPRGLAVRADVCLIGAGAAGITSPGNLPELDCVSASSKAAGCSLNTRNRRRYMPVPTSGFPCRWKVDACVFSAERPIIGRGDVRLSVRSISGAVLGFPIAAGLSTVRRSIRTISARARLPALDRGGVRTRKRWHTEGAAAFVKSGMA